MPLSPKAMRRLMTRTLLLLQRSYLPYWMIKHEPSQWRVHCKKATQSRGKVDAEKLSAREQATACSEASFVLAGILSEAVPPASTLPSSQSGLPEESYKDLAVRGEAAV